MHFDCKLEVCEKILKDPSQAQANTFSGDGHGIVLKPTCLGHTTQNRRPTQVLVANKRYQMLQSERANKSNWKPSRRVLLLRSIFSTSTMLMMVAVRLLSATQRQNQVGLVAAFQQQLPISVSWSRHNNQKRSSRRHFHHQQHRHQLHIKRSSPSLLPAYYYVSNNVKQNHQNGRRHDNCWSNLPSSERQSQIIRPRSCSVSTTTKYFLSSSSLSATNSNDDDLPTITTTQYTITEPGVDHDLLYKTVMRHCETLDLYMTKRPIAIHTQDAFDLLEKQLDNGDGINHSRRKPIILDSGCGTGRSTVLLGKVFPNHTIVGVDKSLVRLNRNSVYRYQQQQQSQQQGNQDDDDDERVEEPEEENEDVTLQQPASNVYLVRAELADFWRLWISSDVIQQQYQLDYHYILYPNPYPKQKRFQNRWYGHPSFPLLCRLASSGDHHELIVRSNWKEYLEDFNKSMEWVLQDVMEKRRNEGIDVDNDDAVDGKRLIVATDGEDEDFGMVTYLEPKNALTNFEQKYHKAGEATYELKLKIPNIQL